VDTRVVEQSEALQIQIRRLKILTSVLLIGVASLVVVAAGPLRNLHASVDDRFAHEIPAAQVAAHDFTLIGPDGKPYGRLFTKGDEPALELYGKNGKIIWSAPNPTVGIRPIQVEHR